jgi:hypothetical protein
MEGKMIVNKILKNQIMKIVKSQLGINTDSLKIRKLENDIRSLRRKVVKLEKITRSKLNLEERDGTYYIEEKDG